MAHSSYLTKRILLVLLISACAYGAKYQKHHVFPRKFRHEFEKRGIDIDKYTVKVDINVHEKLHGKGCNCGNKWNKEWDRFFKNNPNATAKDIHKKAQEMISNKKDYPGIDGRRTYTDDNTDKPSNRGRVGRKPTAKEINKRIREDKVALNKRKNKVKSATGVKKLAQRPGIWGRKKVYSRRVTSLARNILGGGNRRVLTTVGNRGLLYISWVDRRGIIKTTPSMFKLVNQSRIKRVMYKTETRPFLLKTGIVAIKRSVPVVGILLGIYDVGEYAYDQFNTNKLKQDEQALIRFRIQKENELREKRHKRNQENLLQRAKTFEDMASSVLEGL